jgi:hypothetical protein
MDHKGYPPLLVKSGFTKNIYGSEALETLNQFMALEETK